MTEGAGLATIDLTVRGAGMFGLTAAWDAVRRGARVRVIDPRGPGGGASGGVVGALAPHAPENWNDVKAFQRDCLLAARTYWPEVAAAAGKDPGFRATGRLQPIADAAAEARARARATSAHELWQGHAEWQVTDAPGAFAPTSPTGLWVYDTLSAQLDPPRTMAALAQAIRAAGGEVMTEGVEAGAVLHATGWEGLIDFAQAIGQPIARGVKGQAAVLKADLGRVPQVFVDGLHIVAHGPGRVAIGSTSENAFEAPETVDDQLDGVIAQARAAMPVLADAPVIARWAGVRARARSRAPVVGEWPGRPGHVVANGGFKIGFALAPGLAPFAVDLALEGRDSVPKAFRLDGIVS